MDIKEKKNVHFENNCGQVGETVNQRTVSTLARIRLGQRKTTTIIVAWETEWGNLNS